MNHSAICMYLVHSKPCHHRLWKICMIIFWRGVGIDRPQTAKKNVKTYSKGKSPWHFPHCCSKLKPCWKWKRPWNQIWRHSLYPHLHVRCEGKRRKVLPVRRWDWDCPEMREASDGTKLDEVLHHHEGKYGNDHAKYCCCDLRVHPPFWSAASPDPLWFSPFFSRIPSWFICNGV